MTQKLVSAAPESPAEQAQVFSGGAAPVERAAYVRGPVERFGRRYKMEYVGMASVFAVIGLAIFGRLEFWYQSLAATLATYGLFMGIKKKTRDHLSASMLMFAAALVARGGIMDDPRWVWPWLLFGISVLIMEGYLEKLQNHIYALPVVFAFWGWTDLSWVLGLVFVVNYLVVPLPEKPEWRRRLVIIVPLAAVAATVATALRFDAVTAAWQHFGVTLLVPDRPETVALAVFGIPVLVALAAYWRKTISPRRLNVLIFAVAALWDARLIAFFALSGAVLLSATVFHMSIDSDRLRPLFKHAEWHFFWYVLALAIWSAF